MKNKTSVQNITRVALGALLVSSSLFFSCPQAGLGPTVDTEAPKVEIISPVTKSVVSRTITISGTASDDKKLNSLSLNLEGTTYKRTKKIENIAVLEDGTWTCNFDTKSLLDDSYSITAEAIDAENKKSYSTVIYEIDNTAPVLVLDRPNSTTESQSEDIDSFGVKISVKGTVTDDHEVRTLSFKVYDSPDDVDPIAEKKFTNFGKDFDLNPGDDFYDTAYGAESGVKTLYYTISAEDEAGNESEVFYLRENLANAGDKDYGGITITSDELSGKNIYSANNKTFYAGTDGKDDLAKLAKSEKLLEAAMEYEISGVADSHKSIGKFTVEKSSTPSFSLQGISKTELGNGISADSLADKVQDVISKTTALSFLISPNKNGDLLAANAEDVKARMKVYAVRVTEITADGKLLNGDTDVTSQESGRWTLLPISGEVKKSGTSYTFNVSAENLGYYTYAIRLVGKDTKGHPFENEGDPYLITIESSNAKPDIVFDDENTIYIKEDGSILISGKAYSHVVPTDDDGGKTYLIVKPVIAGIELNISPVGRTDNRIECKERLNGFEAAFDFEIKNDTIKRYLDPKLTESGKSVLETTVGVRAIDDGQKENTEEIQLRYDKELPTVKINSLLPTLKIDGKDNVNGDLALNAEWNDRNLDKTIVSVVSRGVETTIKEYGSKFNSSDEVIDTTKYSDGEDLEIKVTTYDLAGNITSVSRTVRVNQASDIPSVTFENIYDYRSYADYLKDSKDSLKNVFYATTDTLRGSLSDDDGISTLEVRAAKYVEGGTAKDAVWDQMAPVSENDGYIEIVKDDNQSKEYRFEFKLKDKDGNYLSNGEYYLQFRVKDCQGTPSDRETEPVWIAVDEDKPFITLTASEGSFMAGGIENSIGGSVQDSSGIVTLSTEHTFLDDDDPQRKFETSSDEVSDKVAHTWTDKFTAPSDSAVYEINYKAKDKYGREESKKVTFKIDMTPPVITVTDWGAELIKTDSSAYKQIKLKSEDKAADDNDSNVSGVKAVYYRISSEGVEPTDWIECGKAGEITVSINFGDESLARFLDKTITLEFKGKDSAGNESDWNLSKHTFYTDTTAPSVKFGTLDSDFKTNTSFTISGTASDNDGKEVVAYVHSRNITSKDGIIGSGTKLDNTGTDSDWKFTVPANTLAPDGLWRVTVVATDKNGRTNLDEMIDTNDYYEFTVDNTAPEIHLSNLSDEDKISSSSFTINGSIIEDTSGIEEVKYTTDKTAVSDDNGTTVSNPSANMQINLHDLKEQDYEIQIRVKDKAGNIAFYPKAGTGDDCFVTIHVDQESPRATFGNSADTTDIALLQSNENLVIKGFADDAKISINRQAESIKLEYNKEGTTFDVTSDTDWDKATGAWTYTLPKDKGDGDYVFTLTVTDIAGKTATVSRNVKIDTTAPTLSISYPADGFSVENGKIEIRGSASDYGVGFSGNHIFYSLDGRADVGIAYNNSASWSSGELDLGTTEGTHTVSVYAVDALGNKTATETRTFYFDKSQPVITETKIGTTDTVSSGATVEFSGTWTETNGVNKIQIQYRKDGGNLQLLETFDNLTPPKTAADGTENWSYSKNDFESGTYEFEITIEDIAGKTNTLTRRVKIDLAAPKAPANIHAEGNSSTSAAGTYYSDKIKFTGTASDDDGQSASGIKEVQYSLDGANWSSDNMMGTSNWQVEIPGTSFSEEKEYTVYFRAIDNSNNVGPVSTTPVLIDKNNPVATIEADGEERTGAYSTRTIALSGTASDTNRVASAGLTVSKDGGTPVAATAGNGDGEFSFDSTTGTWTYSKTVPQDEESTYDFVLTVTDIAGKTATKTQSLKVDTKAPELTTTLTDEAVYTNKTTQTFSVRAQDGSSGLAETDAIIAVLYPSSADRIAGSNGEAQAIAGNTLTVNFAQKYGQVVVVTTKDKLGNTKEYAYTVDADTVRPEISGINAVPVTGYLKAGDTYSFDGTAKDNLGVKKIEVTATLGGVAVKNGKFPYTKEFDDGKTALSAADLAIPSFAAGTAANNGTWRFNITASDKAGNSTSSTVEFVVDVSAPEIESITDVPVKTTDTVLPFLFKGKAKDTGTSGISKIEYKIGTDGTWTEGTAGSNWLAEVQELTEGSGKIYVRATDGAGNISAVVSKDFFYDKAYPSVSVTGEAIRQDNKLFSLGGSAGDTNGLAKVEVVQTKDGVSYTKTINVSGTSTDWKAENAFPLSANETTSSSVASHGADGTYEYTVKVTDVATKTTTSAQKITVTIDTKAPVAPVVSTPSASETGTKALSGATYRFSGTVADNDGGVGIAGVEYVLGTSAQVLDSSSTGTQAELDSAGRNWNFTKDLATGNGAAGTLSEGTYYLYVRATDKAGNVGEWSAARVFDVDQSAPSVAINSEFTGGVNYFGPETASGTITITGTVSDTRGLASTDAIVLKAGAETVATLGASAVAGGTWSVTVPSTKVNANSNTTIYVTAKDAVGKTTAGTCIVYYDNVAPSFSTNLTDNAKIDDSLEKTYTINRNDNGSGLASSGDLVMTYNGNDTTIPAGATSVNITFIEGNGQTVKFTAKDAVGNTEEYTYTVSADVTSPVLGSVTSAPANGYLKKGETFNFGGTASDNLGVAKVTVTATKDGNAVAKEVYSHEKTFDAGKTSLSSEDLAIPSFGAGEDASKNGTWRFVITVYDEVGKSASSSVEFTVDVSAPVISTITSVPERSKDTVLPFDFRGTAVDVGDSGLAKIEYSLTGADDSWKEATTGKNWIALVSGDELTTEGAGTIYVRATDGAGNVGEVKSQEYYFDKASPSITVNGGTARQERGQFTIAGNASDTNALTKVTITQTKAGTEGSLVKELTVSGKTDSWSAADAFPLSADDTAYTAEEIRRNEADGTYTYTITVTDDAGKTASAPAVIVTIDTKAPDVPVISTPKADETGTNALTGTNYKFTGTVSDNQGGVGVKKVEYALLNSAIAPGGAPSDSTVAVATLDSAGTKWSFDKGLVDGTSGDEENLGEGSYWLYVRATDKADNVSGWSTGLKFDIDRSNPSITIDSSLTQGTNYFGGTKGNSITLSGTVSDTRGLDSDKAVELSIGGTEIAAVTKADAATGTWSAVVHSSDVVANALNTVKVTAKDEVGKTVSTTCDVFFDDTAPTFSTTLVNGSSITDSATQTYTVSRADNGVGLADTGALKYTYKGSTVNVEPSDTSVTINFNQGNDQTVVFTVTDKLGNTADHSYTVNVDTESPVLSGLSSVPESGYLAKNGTYSFVNGTTVAKDNIGIASVTVTSVHGSDTRTYYSKTFDTVLKNGDESVASSLGIPTFEAGTDSVKNGTWRFTITIADKAGRTTSESVEFAVDVSSPEVTGITAYPKKNVDSITPYTFRGTAEDVGSGISTIEYSLTSATGPWKTVDGSGKNWYSDVALTKEGAGTIYVRATDGAGNVGDVKSQEYYFDKAGPSITVNGGTVRQEQGLFTLAGSASDSNALTKVTITQTKAETEGSLVKEIAVSGTSADWSAAFPLKGEDAYTAEEISRNEADGTYTYTIKVSDAAGKVTTAPAVTVTIDTTAPNVPGISSPTATALADKAVSGTSYKFSGTVSDNAGGVGIAKVEYVLGTTAQTLTAASEGTAAELFNNATNWNFTKDLATGSAAEGSDALSEGTYYLYVRATDAAGNKSGWSAARVFDVDQSAPALALDAEFTAGTDYFGGFDATGTAVTSITLSGTVSDSYKLDETAAVTLKAGGNALVTIPASSVGADGKWTATINSTDIEANKLTALSITALDGVGKTSSVSTSVYYDNKAPTLTTSFKDGESLTTSTTKEYTIDVSDLGSGLKESGYLSYTYNDVTTPISGSSVTITFNEGNDQVVLFNVEDNLGNKTSYRFTANVDTKAPSITEITAAPAYLKAGDTYSFGGKTGDEIGVEKVKVTATHGNETADYDTIAYNPVVQSEDLAIKDFAAGTDSKNNGTWRFNITASDKAGNSTSTTVEFVVDVSAPVISAITSVPEQSKDTVLPFDFRGTAVDVGDSGLAKIEYSLTGADDSWKEATTGKNWIALVSGDELTTEGAGTIYVRATDVAGNTGTVVTKDFYFDSSKPTVSVTGESTRQASALFTLEGTASDTNGLTKVTITQKKTGIEGSLTKELAVRGTSADWSAADAFPLSGNETAYTAEAVKANSADGEYTYTIVATDKAGKTSAVSTVTVTIDTTAPNVPVISSPAATARADKAVNGTSYKFSGTVSDNAGGVGIAKVEYVLSKTVQTLTAASEGTAAELFNNATNWNFTKDLATGAGEGEALSEGTYYLYVRATDAAGNKSGWSTARVFDVDQSAPALALDAKFTAGTNYFGGPGVNSITVKGTVSDSYKLDDTAAVTLKAGDKPLVTIPASSVKAGEWTATINASDLEANKLTALSITALDGVGKTSSVSTSVYYDNKAPTLTTSFKDGESLTTSTEKEYTIDVSDLGSGLKESGYLSYTYNDVTTPISGSSVTITFNEGNDQVVLFNVEDNLGNKANYRFTANVDTKAPSITGITAAPAYLKADDTYSFGGKTEDEIGVEKIRVTATHGNETADFDEIKYNPVVQSENLAIKDFAAGTDAANNGTWRFNITASDKAGNSTSTTVEFVVDVSAPVITGITSAPTKERDTVLPFDFRGTAVDVGDSGLAKIEYSLTGADDSWKEATTGKNWIALVSGDELTTEGAGTIHVRATDVAGNTGTVVTKDFYFDRSKPTVSVTGESTRQASALFTLEGTASDTNGLTKVTITQSKTGIEGSLTKELTVSGTSAGWKAENAFPLSEDDTAYTADSVKANNADGEYTYTIVATDEAGKTSAVSTVTVTIDTTAPSSIAITAPTAADTGNNALNGTSYKFSGTVADNKGGVGIAKVEYALLSAALPENGAPSDGAIQEATLASSGTAWSFNKDLATGTAAEGSDALSEGTYYLYVRATDAAGNKSGWSEARVFDVDQSAPALALASGLTDGTNYFGGADSTSITLSGTAGDSYKLDSTAAVTLKAGDTTLATIAAAKVGADGNWSATISSADITANTLVTITATAKDAVGKTSASSCNVYYDSEAPALTVTSPAEGTITTTGKFTIKGSIMDSGAGIDTANEERPTIAYTVKNTKNNTGESIIFADKVSLEAKYYNGASWTKEITLLDGSKEGTLELSFTVQDKLGNTSTTEPITFYFDKSSPTLTETAVGNDVKYTNTSVSMEGNASDTNMLESVKLSVTGGTLDSPYVLTAYTNGSETETADDDTIRTSVDWTSEIVAGTAMPGEGTYSVTVTATDTAGNTRSVERSIVYDLTAPVFKTEDDKKPRVTTVAADTTNGWYGTGELDFEGILTDNYELDKVEYSLDGGNTWTRFDTATTAVEKEVEFSKKLVFTNSGTYTVKIKATDRAGNVGTTEVTGIKIDLTVPGVSITSPESGKTVNGESDVNVKVFAKDVHSGLSGIKVQLNNSDFSSNNNLIPASTEGENGEKTYEATIGKSGITAAGTIYVQAIDNVGKTTVTSVPFGFDNVPPTLSITSPAAGTELNKEIDIIGRAGDTALKNVTVYCQNVATAEDFAADNAEAWSSIGSFDGTAGYNWNVHLDTATAYTDGTLLYVKAVAEDEAGNTTETDVFNYTINQDADRPVITLQNVAIWGTDNGFMGQTNVSGIRDQSTLIGTVSDDDGIASMGVKVYDRDGNKISIGETDFKYANYSWTLKLNGDGYQEIDFYVTDTAGTTFSTGKNNSYSLDSIILKDDSGHAIGTNTETGYAGGEIKGGNSTGYDTRLYLTVDNLAPTVLKTEFRLSDADPWVSDLGAITVGGENKNLQVRQYVYDENSVQGVTVSIDKMTGDTDAEAGYYEKAAVAKGSTITEGGKTYTGYEATLNVEKLVSRSLQIKISASDMSGHASNVSYAVTLDNTPPSLEVNSHNYGQQVSGTVQLKGATEGAATKLQYLVSTSAEKMDVNALAWETAAEIQTKDYWRIYFDNELAKNSGENADGWAHAQYLKYYVADLIPGAEKNAEGVIVKAGTADEKYTDLVTLYVHFRMEDAVKNTSTSNPFALVVDPQGDLPSIEVSYPDAYTEKDGVMSPGVTLGGTIRMYGSADDSENPAGMTAWMQIDTEYKGYGSEFKWNGNTEELFAGVYTVEQIEINDVKKEKAIRIGSGISWTVKLNTKNEFSETEAIGVKVFMYDAQGNKSNEEIRMIKINKDAPVFGSSQDFYLQQYDDNGNVTASVQYSDGMWLKGEWFLVGSIEDDGYITEISVTPEKEKPVDLLASDVSKRDFLVPITQGKTDYERTWSSGGESTGESTKKTTGYVIKYPVGNKTENTFGTLTYVISATDNGESGSGNANTTKKTISLQFDNKAPVMAEKGDSAFNISDEVVQKNGFYTLGSTVKEEGDAVSSQSGFERLAFYFVRRGSVNAVYDPFLTKNTEGNKLSLPGLKDEDGLYWKTLSVTRDESNLAKLTLSAEDPNVHTGGLVKIGGAIYRINSLESDGTVVVLSGSPEFANTSAMFAIAQIVDNTASESNGGDIQPNGYYNKVKYDDGDTMVEEVTKQGTTYYWSASINSRNIPDGKVEIHLVAFDKAGNYSDQTISAEVSNNKPMIAAVYYGNDDDGNGTVEDSEYKVKNWALNYVNSEASATAEVKNYEINMLQDVVTINGGESYESALTVRGAASIKPQVVGGNGKLFYNYTVARRNETNKFDEAYYKKTDLTPFGKGTEREDLTSDHTNGSPDGIVGTNGINFSVKDLLSAGNVGSEIKDGVQQFSFTIWDSTDDTTPGEDSLNTTVNIVMYVAIRDTTKPVVGINPFYWNGITENSIYGSSDAEKFSDLKGHIELEGDLPSAFNGTSGLKDKDPKVSGKVVITGTASDNNLLSELFISLDGMNGNLSGLDTETVGETTYYRVATYNRESQEWTSVLNDLDGKGLVFAVDSQSFADGHHVNWSLTWDTEKVQGVAKLDASLKVLATDLGTPTLDGDGDNVNVTYASNTAEAASYRMDVVPYVVKVYTTLAKQKANNWSVYNRTAQGHYPVQSVIQKASTAETANGTIQRTTKSEDVTLHGFNLNGTVAITGATNPSVNGPAENALAQITFNVANLASGELEATVNGIALMNNLNNNDAKGSATVPGTANVNKYNMQGNGDTNNILTDDLVFDVWEFNDRAAVPINGMATGVQMQVNQVSHMLNFAFANGGLFYSMGGKVGNVDYSSIYWAADWDTFAGPCTGLVVDSLGYTYSVDSGGDTNNSGSVDKYNLYTSRWGRGSRNTDGTLSGKQSRRLEEIAIKTGDGTYDYSLMKYRYLSSELATSVRGTTTNLYLVNYDALTDEIRFRAGAFNNTTVGDKGGFVDEYKNGNSSYYSTNNCQVIANSRNGGSFPADGRTTDVDSITGRGAGQYVDIAIATNGPNSKDVACVVWFDAYDNCLKYTYYVDPIANWTNLKSDNTAKGWSDPTTIFAEGGEYCQIAVDANNHIHIAAYAGNGDVKYAYLESYNSSYSESDNSCTVDASGAVGEHLTLDVALDGTGATANSIPYIGYFTSAIKAPKYAYLVDTNHENKVPAGVDANESFTGAWEVTVVPTPSRLTTNREDKVNIGVFKTTDGVLNWSTTNGSQPAADGSNIGTNECSSSAKGYGDSTETSKAYGNGSKNAVFAYQISGGSGSCIETAQMRSVKGEQQSA